jgi:uncharacterized protein (DUF486 family)
LRAFYGHYGISTMLSHTMSAILISWIIRIREYQCLNPRRSKISGATWKHRTT